MTLSTFSKRLTLALPLAVALLVGGSGCQPGETRVEAGNRAQELYVGIGAEPATLDPHLAVGVPEFKVLLALFEGLVKRDAKTLEIKPAVARSWEISEDATTYTFHFDPDARWSNGDRVTPEDFRFSIERILNANLGSSYAKMLFPLRKGEAYHRGEVEDFDEVGVRILDPYTLELTLEYPLAYFLDLLAHGAWYPVHPPTILAYGNDNPHDRLARWTRPGRLVGNGPFQLAEWRLNAALVVRPNPYFRAADQVRLNEIHFHPIQADAEERAFRNGFLHYTSTVPPHRVQWYQTNQPEDIRFDTYLGTYYFMFNTLTPGLEDPRVRRALSLSIDREAITRAILRGGQKPAYHFTPPDTAGYTSPSTVPHDPERARELLAEAGFPGGAGFPEIEFLYNTSDAHRSIALAVQQMWRRELGIDIRLYNVEWGVYLARRRNRDFEMMRAGWIGDYNDPSTFLDLFTAGSSNNFSGWSDDVYDEAIRASRRTLDPEQRAAYFARAEEILLREGPVIPVYFYVNSLLIDPAVGGHHPNVLDYHPYQHLYLRPPGGSGATP